MGFFSGLASTPASPRGRGRPSAGGSWSPHYARFLQVPSTGGGPCRVPPPRGRRRDGAASPGGGTLRAASEGGVGVGRTRRQPSARAARVAPTCPSAAGDLIRRRPSHPHPSQPDAEGEQQLRSTQRESSTASPPPRGSRGPMQGCGAAAASAAEAAEPRVALVDGRREGKRGGKRKAGGG